MRLFLGLLSLVCFSFWAHGQEDQVKLTAEEAWSNLLGGKEHEVHLLIQSDEAVQGRVGWSFAVGRAVVVRRETPLKVEAGKPARVAVRLPAPEVRAGVILEGALTASVFADGKDQPLATLQKKLWLFPADPFADRQEWLKGLNLHLYDPGAKTAEALQKVGVPFEEIRNADALADLTKGLLLIGEKVSFREEPALAESVFKAAQAGVPVLCLAPAEGTFPVPGVSAKALPMPAAVALNGADKITALDKRLDAGSWTGNRKAVIASFAFKSEGEETLCEVRPEASGWPWLQIRFERPGGQLIFCGFGVIQHWEASPTPRFLLLKILELLSEKK